MLENITTIVIIGISGALFGHWFRYACLLILAAKTPRDYGLEVAATVQLSFPAVDAELREETSVNFAKLHAALDDDFKYLSSLIAFTMEDRMVQLDYQLMSLCRRIAPRRSLREMSMVIAYFANRVGEQAALGAVN